MQTHVYYNKKGFTLVELLVAVVILMVGLLGLLQTVGFALSHNFNNQLRQEAVYVADQVMSLEKSKTYENIAAPAFDPAINDVASLPTVIANSTVSRTVNRAPITYAVVMTNRAPTSQSKSIDVEVSWQHRGRRYTHTVASIVTAKL
jgi:type IV pilus assembly protein PilV